jgi:hypothetical protein
MSEPKYGDLDIVCGTCGKLMRRLGEWPIQFPRDPDGAKNIQQVSRYVCHTCRMPHPEYAKGTIVGISIIEGAL